MVPIKVKFGKSENHILKYHDGTLVTILYHQQRATTVGIVQDKTRMFHRIDIDLIRAAQTKRRVKGVRR